MLNAHAEPVIIRTLQKTIGEKTMRLVSFGPLGEERLGALIEDGKRFDVMVYPTEPHVIQTESSRLDFVRRSVEFFDRHLRGKRD